MDLIVFIITDFRMFVAILTKDNFTGGGSSDLNAPFQWSRLQQTRFEVLIVVYGLILAQKINKFERLVFFVGNNRSRSSDYSSY